MGSESDASIIAASLAAPEVFGTLFDRHARTLFRYLVRRIGPDEADSLLGELFRIAFEKRSTYDLDRENARPWLYGIATNLLRHWFRASARRAPDPPAHEWDFADEALGRVEARALGPDLALALRTVAAADRDALLLHAWAELTYTEIAHATGVPVGTVRSRIHRARTQLRAHLEGADR